MQYPVAIRQQDFTFYAYLPDLPELSIEGNSIADTIARARAVVFEHLQKLADDEQSIPAGSDVSAHLSNGQFAGWTWGIISVDPSRIIGETVSMNIQMSERLMQRLLSHVESQQLDVNDFLIDAIKKGLSASSQS